MFRYHKKSKEVLLHAPIIGKSVRLEEVPDQMFAKKLLGDGLAFVYEGDTIYAPCDGTVIMIADTKHALGIKAVNQAEIMIHIGLDTVNLLGEGFEVLVASNDRIKQGQPLVKLGREALNKQSLQLITRMIVTSRDTSLNIMQLGDVCLSDSVISLK